MEKDLSEMTLEELWQLFPIILKEYNPSYTNWYAIEKDKLITSINNEDIVRINHIGSTFVPRLISKPTIDILLEINEKCDIKELKDMIISQGWILMSSSNEGIQEMRISFNKGYTPKGFAEKVYHLHVRYFGDWGELYFRDLLLKYNAVANEYGKLKLQLISDYKHNRDGYTDAKSDFVKKYTELARKEFPNKYSLVNKV